MLSDEIKRAAQREAIAKLDAGESEIKAQVIAEIGEPFVELSTAEKELVIRWCSWTEACSVRRNPAKPWVLARWILLHRNDSRGSIVAMLAAVDKLHQLNGLSSPVRTDVVNRALSKVLPQIEPPRSWTKADKASFALLDVQTQEVIENHERRREKELRRCQNELADLKKRHSATAADTNAVQTNVKETVS